jgi:hypothetical protein
LRILVRVLLSVILGFVAWAVVGYLATLPLGAIYGWSGHPAIPAAPWSVYVALYLVLLPVICLAAAWYLAGRLIGAISRR